VKKGEEEKGSGEGGQTKEERGQGSGEGRESTKKSSMCA